ncbi:MAG: thioredoxin domain-containing protein [SAR324 cluster bacterium]|nr:thioredoxin domain-containing protein [SAR324 cluster bacterium]
MSSSPEFSNRLIHEKSPYLLQHAHNPVDWQPWGPEAFTQAKVEDKLVLVSIGYATCHWCHVMERESFEDPELAAFLNAHFVPIKVDREERPDVDKLHMDALHGLGQQGGWPLNMFVLPDGRPITGGTYFPPCDLYGRPSFRTVLEKLVQLWRGDRGKLEQVAGDLLGHLQHNAEPQGSGASLPGWEAEEVTAEYYRKSYDPDHGGFQLQPQNKFPPSMGLQLLLRHHVRTDNPESLEMAEHTLQKMLAGGIYDQIGGGLSRYSTDYEWLVPHFEKMLYDNALFVWALLEAHQVTGKDVYADGARDVLAYIERDMRSPEGAFFSAEDADSEGVEGKFYVWTPSEVRAILRPELAERACAFWDISDSGNFEGSSIPNRPQSETEVAEQLGISVDELNQNLAEARQKLLEARSHRIRPLCDDKVLTSWNALMISAFARASRILDEPHYEALAVAAAEFVFQHLREDSGRLLRRWREGESRFPAYLVDHAQLAVACLDLYEATYHVGWFRKAQELMEEVDRLFRNDEGAYFDTGEDAERLLMRSAEGYDGVEPSGNSAAAQAFLRLHACTGNAEFLESGLRILSGFSGHLQQAGPSFAAMLQALHAHRSGIREIVIAGTRGEPETESLLSVVRREFHPNTVTAFVPVGEDASVASVIPLAQGRTALNGHATAYVCQNFACQLPVHTPDELRTQLQSRA